MFNKQQRMKANNTIIMSDTFPTNSNYFIYFSSYKIDSYKSSLAYLASVVFLLASSLTFLLAALVIIVSDFVKLLYNTLLFPEGLLNPFNGSLKNYTYLFIEQAPHKPILI